MMNFTKWQGSPPTQVGYDCGIMQATTTYWTASPCTTKRPFICSFSDHPCPDGWEFNELNNYCYYTPMGVEWSGIYYRNNVTIDLGEQYCNTPYRAHLVSIHSDQENEFVRALAAKSIADYSHSCSSSFQWLIGLKSTNWTDGTAFDYDKRASGGSTFGIKDPECASDQWDYWGLERFYTSYICKKAVSAFRADLPKRLAAVREAATISRLTNTPFVLPEFVIKH